MRKKLSNVSKIALQRETIRHLAAGTITAGNNIVPPNTEDECLSWGYWCPRTVYHPECIM
jgi:hypothetical protein